MLRRDFLSGSFALAVAATRTGLARSAGGAKSILDYGARPDGKTLNTNAIQRAIDIMPRVRTGIPRDLPHEYVLQLSST